MIVGNDAPRDFPYDQSCSSRWMTGVAMNTYMTLFNNGLMPPRFGVFTGCPVMFNAS